MFDSLFQADPIIMSKHSIVSGLAAVLPLWALVDFVYNQRALHLGQVADQLPLWCWTVAPTERVMLVWELSEDEGDRLDRFMNERHPDNPGALVENQSSNMAVNGERRQKLDLVEVSVQHGPHTMGAAARAVSVLGWLSLTSLCGLAYVRQLWLGLAFLIIVPLTGLTMSATRGDHIYGPPSPFNRLAVVTNPTNERGWQVFYGDRTIVNRLLNWPMRTNQPSAVQDQYLGVTLRALVFTQWILAVAAAVCQTLDAFLISLWILVSLVRTSATFTSGQRPAVWLSCSSNLELRHVTAHFHSRGELINMINPPEPDTPQTSGAAGDNIGTLSVEETNFLD